MLGGVLFYEQNDRWYLYGNEIEEIKNKTSEHHGDSNDRESYEIYPGDVAEKIKNNEEIILLDVRTPEEYEEIHLENAFLLPVQQLSQQSLNEIGLDESMKDKEIILYCRSGARSKTAHSIMESLGYTNVKSVSGGILHWEEDGYPFTESGAYKNYMKFEGTETVTVDTQHPQIVFDRTEHDFGVIPQFGGTVEADFIVTNKGTETLQIGDLTTSCSCTSATIVSTSVKPGESTVLTVIFDPDFHEEPVGVFKRTVFIPTNDPLHPEAEISITVDIAEGQ